MSWVVASAQAEGASRPAASVPFRLSPWSSQRIALRFHTGEDLVGKLRIDGPGPRFLAAPAGKLSFWIWDDKWTVVL